MIHDVTQKFPSHGLIYKDDAASGQDPAFGDLPEWNLSDLYSAPDGADLKADVARAEKKITAFESHRGKIAGLDSAAFGQLIADYEVKKHINRKKLRKKLLIQNLKPNKLRKSNYLKQIQNLNRQVKPSPRRPPK